MATVGRLPSTGTLLLNVGFTQAAWLVFMMSYATAPLGHSQREASKTVIRNKR